MPKLELYHNDCIKQLATIGDKSIECCVTDIPYGEVNRADNGLRKLDKGAADIETFPLEKLLVELDRIITGSIYMFCGTEQVSVIRHFLVEHGFSTRLLIWEKTNPSPMNGDHIWLSGIECCVYGKRKGATYNGHCKNTVLRYPNGTSKFHPTQKPTALIKELVLTSTNEGDTVIDPCMGSGTTGEACVQTGRGFIGIELEKEFYDYATTRIKGQQSQNYFVNLLADDNT